MSALVARLLSHQLAAAGLKPEPLCLKMVWARMRNRGEEEFERLALGNGYGADFRLFCRHHLGVGASLTEFLVKGVQLDKQRSADVAFLGGLAHTIFSSFDSLLDANEEVPRLFEGASEFAAGENGQNTKQQFVLDLVRRYYETLTALAPLTETRKVRDLLDRAIRKLYDAELSSAKGDLKGGLRARMPALRVVWWRKNALPIVVMGLPCWLWKPGSTNIQFMEHLRWLAAVGEFFGWIDDFADYETDGIAGHTNRLRWEGANCSELQAHRVAQKGRLLLDFWDSKNETSPVRDTFKVILWTWLPTPT